MKTPANFVEVRILRPNASSRNIAESISFFVSEGDDLVFRSALPIEETAADHLKWLYGLLKFHRKIFRQLEANGTEVVVRLRVQERKLSLPPEALLLMHQLHLPTEIQLGR